jgi:hypothetical protein
MKPWTTVFWGTDIQSEDKNITLGKAMGKFQKRSTENKHGHGCYFTREQDAGHIFVSFIPFHQHKNNTILIIFQHVQLKLRILIACCIRFLFLKGKGPVR